MTDQPISGRKFWILHEDRLRDLWHKRVSLDGIGVALGVSSRRVKEHARAMGLTGRGPITKAWKPPVQELAPAIIRLAEQGMKPGDIARKLGCSYSHADRTSRVGLGRASHPHGPIPIPFEPVDDSAHWERCLEAGGFPNWSEERRPDGWLHPRPPLRYPARQWAPA